MKTLISLLVILTALMTAGLVSAAVEKGPAGGAAPTTVTLTANDVTSAIDIERAVQAASAYGTRPATIILDGSAGPFVYDSPDRSINIFYPNLTFRGTNGAVFANTGDGFFFDDLLADNIRIEDLFMVCEGSAVAGGGQHKNVIVRGNTFRTGSIAIGTGPGKNWTISENTILAGAAAVQVVPGASSITIINNEIHAPEGILLEGAVRSRVANNTISAGHRGIALLREAYGNEISRNSVLGVQSAGIELEPDVTDNRVTDNKVLCALWAPCQTVAVAPQAARWNQVSDNLP